MSEEARFWQRGAPVDPVGLASAVNYVDEHLCGNPTLAKNVRVILGFLQGQKVDELAGTLRLNEPMDVAARRDAYDRGFAHGLEEASLVADTKQLGAVLDWLNRPIESGEEE